MANYSDLTRKEQVLQHLQERIGEWVDGPELANEKVGGSEGHRRVRELRAEGHRILVRAHPDPARDIHQYKLVATLEEARRDFAEKTTHLTEDQLREQIAADIQEHRQAFDRLASNPPDTADLDWLDHHNSATMPMVRSEEGEYLLTFEVCPDCGGSYKDEAEHRESGRHARWEAKQDKEPYKQERVPIEPQPPSMRYSKKPEKVVMGETVFCPRCKGYKRPGKFDKKKGEFKPGDPFCVDPFRRMKKGELNPCERCGGIGLVPA